MVFYRPPTTQWLVDALGTIYRALRSWKLYPQGHPSRLTSIRHAHSTMRALLDGHDFSLCSGRTNFSFPDGEIIKDSSSLSTSLSHELFVRRVLKITFLQDLCEEDMLAFLKILALTPDNIQRLGGVDKIMAEQGVRTIWVNEFDLSVILEKRRELESRGVVPAGIDETEGGSDISPVFEQQEIKPDDATSEQELPVLIGRLIAARDDETYMMLLRQAISCCDVLKSQGEPLELFPLLELLASHVYDAARSESMREFARFAIEQISTGAEFIKFVLDRMEQTDGLSKVALQAVISTGGTAAVTLAVEQMGLSSNLAARKSLSKLLASMGDEVVPPLLDMLGDSRWFIVRNISVVLGDIASPEAIQELTKCLRHRDIRVSKEAIRSLAKIGGCEAESALIATLQQDNPLLYPQVIATLSGMKSKNSLADLMKIVSARDMFLKSLPLKNEALAAIAMIGDRQVTPDLLILLTKRHLLAQGRWKQLKSAIAQCLGKLGDPQALPVLVNMSSTPGELGAACREAVDLIQKSGGYPNVGP